MNAENAFASLAFVAVACPSTKLLDTISFYSILGLTKPHEEDTTDSSNKITTLEAAGYENTIDQQPFQLILIDTPDFATEPTQDEDGDGLNKLCFYCHDVVSIVETIESLELETVVIQSHPFDVGSHVVISVILDPCGLQIVLIQLQAERFYLTDTSHSKKLYEPNQWDIRLGYVQLVIDHPEESAKYLSTMFSDHDGFNGLKIIDSEDFQATKFFFLGNVSRDLNVSLSLKHTPHKNNRKSSSDGSKTIDPHIIRPGQLLSLGLRTTNGQNLDTKIKQSMNLSQILHLGCPLRLNTCRSGAIATVLADAFADGLFYELIETGKELSKLQITLLPYDD